jgi:exopolyphosphatase/guanosine-5'-triphosphate,3'-diphosphate pyrophosphatase
MLVASVDIGTNTVRCLIGDLTGGALRVLDIHREIVRVGAGLRLKGSFEEGPAGKLLEVLAFFGRVIRASGCCRIRAVGTSAFREAGEGKGKGLLASATEALTFPVEVLSGKEEAELTARGVQAGIGPMADGTIVDIGGGSTEIIRVVKGNLAWWSSIPEGVVYLTEEILRDDPPTPTQVAALRERFRSFLLEESDDGGSEAAGTAGTPTTLASIELGIDVYDPTLVNGHVLSRRTFSRLRRDFLKVDSAARLRMPGMEKGREDVIVAGVLMAEEVLDRWGYGGMKVSDWGLLEGVALSAAEGKGYEVSEKGKG